jgi:PhzF family phenazine biosynthesis protein
MIMMKQKLYQVDAFTDKIFQGNPAAVCPLDTWLSDDIMQKIAMENNLSETAFYLKEGNSYHIRWFTPENEVDLCGHATLASAYVLYNYEGYREPSITFLSRKSGILYVRKNGHSLTLDFPADNSEEIEVTDEIRSCFNISPEAAFKGKTDYLLIFGSEGEIENLVPHFGRLSRLDCRGVIVSARGAEVDFVSRFFAPRVGVSEDPVTGSAHTTLTPYWAGVLGRKDLSAIQLSRRRGLLKCRLLEGRVEITGNCRLYMIGEISTE